MAVSVGGSNYCPLYWLMNRSIYQKRSIYLDCPRDIDFVIQRVKEAGGLVVEPKTIISRSLGYYATFEDLEGNYIYLYSLKKTTSL